MPGLRGQGIRDEGRRPRRDRHRRLLPVWAGEIRLTFEEGLVYAIFPHHAHPDDLLTVVDAIVGLLDRTPAVRPRPQGS